MVALCVSITLCCCSMMATRRRTVGICSSTRMGGTMRFFRKGIIFRSGSLCALQVRRGIGDAMGRARPT